MFTTTYATKGCIFKSLPPKWFIALLFNKLIIKMNLNYLDCFSSTEKILICKQLFYCSSSMTVSSTKILNMYCTKYVCSSSGFIQNKAFFSRLAYASKFSLVKTARTSVRIQVLACFFSVLLSSHLSPLLGALLYHSSSSTLAYVSQRTVLHCRLSL